MKLVKFLGILIIALFAANIIYANKLVGYGQYTLDLQTEIIALETANRELELKIAQNKSIATVTEKLEGSDFISNPKAIALTGEGYVALK